ncbi:RING finger protein B [Diplonema papillatum]|nr:RING finger protein B [Diplonema papillatum]
MDDEVTQTPVPLNSKLDYPGLSQFQELWAGVVCTAAFFIILIQILYRSKTRQRRLQRVTLKSRLNVYSPLKTEDKRNYLAARSLQLSKDYRQPFVPYTGRPVPGLVDMRGDDEMTTHAKSKDWLDFREYARFFATAVRGEVSNLAVEGVIGRPKGDLDCYTLRDVIKYLHDGNLLPDTLKAEEGCPAVRASDAVQWLCTMHEKWRYGLRPGAEFASAGDVTRFRAFTESLIRHLQQLSLRCVSCNTSPKTVIFEPCKHFCTCASCSSQLSVCPLCQTPIEHKLPAGGG